MSYDLRKSEDRERLRAEREAELAATQDGSWPRNISDETRWIGGGGAEYAARMCQGEIAYLNHIEARLKAGEQVW